MTQNRKQLVWFLKISRSEYSLSNVATNLFDNTLFDRVQLIPKVLATALAMTIAVRCCE